MTELPDGWRIAQLGEVADTTLGKMLDRGHARGLPTVPYLRNVNVQWGRIDTHDLLTMELADGDRERFSVQPGDLLVCEGGEIGRAAIWHGRAEYLAFQKALHRIRSRGNLNLAYLRYLLELYRDDGTLERFATGSTIAHLPQQKLRALPVPLPPMEEQRQIVDILEDHLSRLDAGVSGSQAAQIRTKQWQRSIMLRAVLGGTSELPESIGSGVDLAGPLAPDIALPLGWRWRKWREVGSSQNGKLFPSYDYSTEGIRLLRPGNMGADGSLTWTPKATRRLPASYANSHAAMLLATNDLVMNLTAQSLKDDFLGRVCIVGPEDSSLLNQRIARLTTSELTPDFALLVFRSPLFREHVKALNTGSLIQHMFTKQINEFWLPVPPKDVQVAVASDVGDKMAVALRMTNAVDTMKTRSAVLRRSLLRAAFSGHLSGRSSDMEMVEEMASV